MECTKRCLDGSAAPTAGRAAGVVARAVAALEAHAPDEGRAAEPAAAALRHLDAAGPPDRRLRAAGARADGGRPLVQQHEQQREPRCHAHLGGNVVVRGELGTASYSVCARAALEYTIFRLVRVCNMSPQV